VLPQMATTTNATRWYLKLEPEPSKGLPFNLDVTLYVVTNLGEIGLHTISIFRIDNLKKFLKLSTDLSDLIVRVRVEEYFL
jgi:hypothetical protein